jgi:DNA-binding transcriptional regulator YiaG
MAGVLMTTPQQIKELRQRLGISQAALAERLGVSIRTVKYWEAGAVPVSRPAAKLLSLMA